MPPTPSRPQTAGTAGTLPRPLSVGTLALRTPARQHTTPGSPVRPATAAPRVGAGHGLVSPAQPQTGAGASRASFGAPRSPGSTGSLRLPPRALVVRMSSRSLFRSEWTELAARHRLRMDLDNMPASAPAPAREAQRAFKRMPTAEFFAMIDGRFPQVETYGHSAELANQLKVLRRSVAHEYVEAEAAPPPLAAREAKALSIEDELVMCAWDELPEIDEAMMRSVLPEDALPLMQAGQYELAAAAFARGMKEQPRRYDQHEAGFAHAMQALRWRDTRSACRPDPPALHRIVRTAARGGGGGGGSGSGGGGSGGGSGGCDGSGSSSAGAQHALIEDAHTGQLPQRMPPALSDAASRARAAKPTFDDGAAARAFGHALSLMEADLEALLLRPAAAAGASERGGALSPGERSATPTPPPDAPPPTAAELASLRARMAARGAELSSLFRSFAQLDRSTAAQMRMRAIEVAGTLSKADFVAFCKAAGLLVAEAPRRPLSGRARGAAAAIAAGEFDHSGAAAASSDDLARAGDEPRLLATTGRGGAAAANSGAACLSVEQVHAVYARAALAALQSGEQLGPADETPSAASRPSSAVPYEAHVRRGAQSASRPGAAPSAAVSTPEGQADSHALATAAAALAEGPGVALHLHGFLGALVLLASTRYGPKLPLADAFDAAWAAHFARARSADDRSAELRRLLDTRALCELYEVYEPSLRAVFDFHAQLGHRLDKRARAEAAVKGEAAAEPRARSRDDVRKYIANRGPTIAYSEWTLFWAALDAADASVVGLLAHAPTSAAAARAERTPLDRLAPTAFAMQRAFLASQSEEEAVVARGDARAEPPSVDTQMTWKEFWEGLARVAADAPAGALRGQHARNELRIGKLTAGRLRVAAGSSPSEAPAELDRAANEPLDAAELRARLEIVLRAVLHVFARIWGGPGSARALVEATLAGGFAAAAAGSAESEELKQTVREMRQTLLARSLRERAHARAQALGLTHGVASEAAAALALAPTTSMRPFLPPSPQMPSCAVACSPNTALRRASLSAAGARGAASGAGESIVLRRPSAYGPTCANGGHSPSAERQVSSRLGTRGVGAIQARERKPQPARKHENDDSSELLNRLASVGRREDQTRLREAGDAIQAEIG